LDTNFVVGDSNSVLAPINSSQNFRQALNSYTLPNYDNATLQSQADYIARTCKKCADGKRIGKGNINTIDLKTTAQYYNPHIAGGKLWIMRITSPTALALMFYFSEFKIPQSSSLFIYTADRTQILGPYTNSNNNPDTTQGIQFETLPIAAKDVFVEYYESDSADFTGTVTFDNIIHLFNNTYSNISPPTSGASAWCQKDACEQPTYAKEVNSVALILAYDAVDSTLNTCTGSLLNNTNQDGTPYFLTASHCLGSSTTSSVYNTTTWVFIFDYQKKCSGSTTSTSPYQKVIYGATSSPHNPLSYDMHCSFSENSMKSDYLFLQLNDNPAGSVLLMDLCYSGWLYGDPLASSQYYSYDTSSAILIIHHPQGDYKKISIGSNLRSADDTGGNDCTTSDAVWTGEYFFNLDINNSGLDPHYGGGIEEGSSGSPVYVENGGFPRLIGTVTGGAQTDSLGLTPIDPCNQDTYLGYYSKFFQDWNADPVTFNAYLDPSNSRSSPAFNGIDTWCSTASPSNPTISGAQYTSQGIKINGEAGTPVLCAPVQSIELEPLLADDFKFNRTTSLISCNSLPSQICSSSGLVVPKCTTYIHTYEIYLYQLNDDGSVKGNPYTHTFNLYCNDQGGTVIPNNSGTNNELDISSITVQINNLHRFPSGPGVPPGYWRMGIGTNYNGWKYSSRDFYVLPSTITRNSTTTDTISSSLIASTSITLEDVFVPNVSPIDLAATDYIQLEDKSHFESGHYFIEPVNCSSQLRIANNQPSSNSKSFNTTNQNNIVPTTNNNQLASISTINKNKSNVLIYPNPTNNDVVIDFKNSSFTNNDITFKVFNSIGQMVKNQISSLNGGTQFNLGLSELNAGIYNVIITQGGKMFQSNIVKQ